MRKRILAIDPTHRGFGYVVLEEPHRLVDWGACQVRTDKTSRSIHRVRDLICRFSPDVFVVEDMRRSDCRRGERVRELLGALAAVASASDVAICRVSAAAVRERYAGMGATNKDTVARLLVSHFPELEPFLPRLRKPWMSEDERMAIFDALGLAIAAGIGRLRRLPH